MQQTVIKQEPGKWPNFGKSLVAVAHLSTCHRSASDTNLLDDPHMFCSDKYLVFKGIQTCSGASSDLVLRVFFSNSSSLNLPLIRSHQEINTAEHLVRESNDVPWLRVELRLCDQACRGIEAFTLLTRRL